MTCPTCGSELDSAGNCVPCATPAVPAVFSSPSGDPFLPARSEVPTNRWKAPLFTILALILFAVVAWLNYLKALAWAGLINAESIGYMMGGIIFSVLLGLLGMYLVNKVRGEKTAPAAKTLGIAVIASVLSMLGLAGEMAKPSQGNKSDAYHQAGNLLKEAAGKQPRSADVHWWDAPSRDFFHDILELNQRYAAEVAALDKSAVKDLYSSKSYGGDVHMQRVVTQLQAVLAVDEKYASVDPQIKKMEAQVAAAGASESEKQEFLTGLRGSLEKGFGSRNDLIHKEEAWIESTIDLYDFTIAHTSDYSIRDNKLYFRNDATKEEFLSEQAKAMALHKDFLKAESAMDESRKSNMNQLGVSPSDLTPSQLGKPR